jgi:ABC-type multidrug transport system fused ATPase/permease subunit
MSQGSPKDEDHPASLAVLWRLRVFVRPHLGKFLLTLGLVLATVGFELAVPRTFGAGIDAIKAVADQADRSMYWQASIVRWAVLLAGLVLLAAAARFCLGLAQVNFQQSILTDMRAAFYDAVQHLSLSYHAVMTTGELIARGTRDVDRFRRFLTGAFFEAVSLVVLSTGVVVMMLRTRWFLAFITLWTVPVVAVMLARFAKRLRPMWRAASDLYGELTTVLTENIAGTRVVKAFGRERDEIRKFDGASDRYLTKTVEANVYWAGRVPVANFVFGLSIPLLLVAGGILVGRGQMSLGELTAYLGYLTMLSFRIRAVGRIVNLIQEAAGSGERFFAVLDEQPLVTERPNAEPMPPGRGRVEFRGVSFDRRRLEAISTGPPRDAKAAALHARLSSASSAGFALRDISFTVAPGQMVAVVGRTGSGKSTLLSLIPRFNDPAAGQVLIDGADVRDLRLSDLRRSIGFIFQEPFLFSATVAETIAYGRPDATRAEIEACARDAQAAEFIDQLPNGYDTVIGERGVTLSGGQRQRLAIARALLIDPRILIMDDATSACDAETEHLIHQALLAVARGRTTFIIAQRLSTVRKADLILVLEQGRIVERGAHDELVARNGTYRQLFATQME